MWLLQLQLGTTLSTGYLYTGGVCPNGLETSDPESMLYTWSEPELLVNSWSKMLANHFGDIKEALAVPCIGKGRSPVKVFGEWLV